MNGYKKSNEEANKPSEKASEGQTSKNAWIDSEEVNEIVETIDSIGQFVASTELSPASKKGLAQKTRELLETLDDHSQDDASDELTFEAENEIRKMELALVSQWNSEREIDIPKEELPWLCGLGFIKVDPEQRLVKQVDKDGFLTLLSTKFAPIVKSFGVDPMAFESAIADVLNPKPTTKKKAVK